MRLDSNGLRLALAGAVDAADTVTISRLGAPLLWARDASTFLARLRGLHGLLPLGPNDALIIRPCRTIHTFRLPVPIDVAFLDEGGAIRKVATVPPGRVVGCARARLVVEMAAGTAARLELEPGHVLSASTGRWAS